MGEKRDTYTAYAVTALLRDGQVYLQKRHNTEILSGYWVMPGGHVDDGETVLDAALKEAKEEAGVSLAGEQVALSTVNTCSYDEGIPSLHTFFVCQETPSEPTIMEPHKASEGKWFALNDLPEKMSPLHRHLLECYATGTQFSHFDQRTKGTN